MLDGGGGGEADGGGAGAGPDCARSKRALAPASRLLLTTDAVGGVWRYTVELAAGIAERGGTVIVAVVGPPASPARTAELPPSIRLIQTGLQLDWLAKTPGDLDRASAALAGIDADIALLHAPALLRHRWPVPVATMVHSCLTTWFAEVRGGPVALDCAWRAEATADGLHRAHAVAAPSHAFAETVRRTYDLPSVTAIHNGRRPMALPAVPRERAVLTAGRLWDDGKNVAVLDQAAATLSAPIRAAGSRRAPDGRETPLHHAQALGSLDEPAMAHALASHSVFASASRYEPFGLAVLEAAQAGLALVLSDIPTFRELWDGAAIFVPPGDPEAWRDALERALAAPQPWADLAQERARRYTVAACVDGTLDVLSRVMAAV